MNRARDWWLDTATLSSGNGYVAWNCELHSTWLPINIWIDRRTTTLRYFSCSSTRESHWLVLSTAQTTVILSGNYIWRRFLAGVWFNRIKLDMTAGTEWVNEWNNSIESLRQCLLLYHSSHSPLLVDVVIYFAVVDESGRLFCGCPTLLSI